MWRSSSNTLEYHDLLHERGFGEVKVVFELARWTISPVVDLLFHSNSLIFDIVNYKGCCRTICYLLRASTHSAEISSSHLLCNVEFYKTNSINHCSNALPWFHFVVSVHSSHWSLQIWWFLLLSTYPSYIWTCAAV